MPLVRITARGARKAWPVAPGHCLVLRSDQGCGLVEVPRVKSLSDGGGDWESRQASSVS